MERLIEIDGKQVKFAANGATPIRYRNETGRDLITDLQKLNEESERKEGYSIKSLKVFEDIAYVMAKTGNGWDNEFALNPIEWLEQFEMFSIYEVLPQILELWHINTATLQTSKKNKSR